MLPTEHAFQRAIRTCATLSLLSYSHVRQACAPAKRAMVFPHMNCFCIQYAYQSSLYTQLSYHHKSVLR